MADIRINALATTAASTASDDFIAVDGSANGTRKLNAYSPTFGGNLTVSGTGDFTGALKSDANGSYPGALSATGFRAYSNSVTGLTMYGRGTDTDVLIANRSGQSAIGVPAGGYNTLVYGNLTVSGGTITGGTSGMSLASGGTNQNISITPSGSGRVHIAKSAGQDSYIELAGNGNTAGTNSVVIGQSGTDLGVIYNRKNADLAFGTNGTEVARFFANGNLFVGASPVDGGQKLQVSGSAIFGSTNTAQLSNPTGQIIRQQFSASTVGLRLEADSANAQAVIGTSSNHSLLLRTNDTTALTLDSSQNATFAGDIRFSSANAFDIGQTGTRVRTAFIKTLVLTSGAPAAANSTGTAGTVTWDSNYIYVCTATDTWKRVAIATWP